MQEAETRYARESGAETRIAAIVEPEIEALGYRLVRVRLTQMNGLTLQIMAERPDGMMSVEDCETVSKAISPILDIEDPISSNYNLEVSSPGIDRPLVRPSDYETWKDHVAKIETKQLIDGRKRFKGRIMGLRDRMVILKRDHDEASGGEEIAIALDDIAEAKLVLTDDLVREALRRDKALRKADGEAASEEE